MSITDVNLRTFARKEFVEYTYTYLHCNYIKVQHPVDRPAVDFQSGFLPRQALHGIQKSVFDPVPPPTSKGKSKNNVIARKIHTFIYSKCKVEWSG